MFPISENPAGNAIRLAKVVKSHPSSNATSLIFLDDGSRAPGVQCIATHASNNSGTINMHRPHQEDADPWSSKLYSLEDQTKRDYLAVVAMLGTTPLVIGFIYPPISQMNFPDTDEFKNLQLDRHASDFVQSLDDNGNYSLHHPSGAHITISLTGAAPDFTEKDYDKRWKITNNKDKQVTITLHTGGSTITMTPDGNISIDADKEITITAGVHVQVTAPKIDLN